MLRADISAWLCIENAVGWSKWILNRILLPNEAAENYICLNNWIIMTWNNNNIQMPLITTLKPLKGEANNSIPTAPDNAWDIVGSKWAAKFLKLAAVDIWVTLTWADYPSIHLWADMFHLSGIPERLYQVFILCLLFFEKQFPNATAKVEFIISYSVSNQMFIPFAGEAQVVTSFVRLAWSLREGKVAENFTDAALSASLKLPMSCPHPCWPSSARWVDQSVCGDCPSLPLMLGFTWL